MRSKMAKSSNVQSKTTSKKAATKKAPAKTTARSRAASTGAEAQPKKATRSRKPKTNGQTQQAADPHHDQVAQRAYEIWVAKGRPMGQDEQCWYEAEQDLRPQS